MTTQSFRNRGSRRLLAALLGGLLLSACGGSGSGPELQVLQGAVTKGPVVGASVELFAISDDGQALLPALPFGSIATDVDGRFQVSGLAAGPFLARACGGEYFDESDPAGERRIVLGPDQCFESLVPNGATSIAVNPYTQALVDKLRRQALADDVAFTRLIEGGRALFETAFGFDVLNTVPANPTAPGAAASAAAGRYAQVLGGLANAINAAVVARGLPRQDFAVIRAFARDLSDGVLDGREAGEPIVVAGQLLPALDINAEIGRFRNNNDAAYAGLPAVQIQLALLGQPAAVAPLPNQAPVAADDAFIGTVGQILNVPAPGVLANDTDPEGSDLTAVLVEDVQSGVLQLNADGGFSYTPDSAEVTSDRFTYRANDGERSSLPATVELSFTPQSVLSVPMALQVPESGGSVTVTVTIDPAPRTGATVLFATSDETAVAGEDYTGVSGTLLFAPGETQQQITIPIVDDDLHEANETFLLELSEADGADINIGTTRVTIVDDDPPPTVSIADLSREEGNAGAPPAVLTVTLSAVSGLPVRMNFATVDGTAVAGSDYQATSGQLTIPAGANSAQISVPIIGDLVFENDEHFLVRLSGLENAQAERLEARVTLRNDDPMPTLSIADTSVIEGDSGTRPMVYTVTLSGLTALPVTVEFATTGGTADINDFQPVSGVLEFPPGQTVRQISVPVIGDLRPEDDETVIVTLSNATGATIARSQGVGVIIDDDAPPANEPPIAVDDCTTVIEQGGTTSELIPCDDPRLSGLSGGSSGALAKAVSVGDGPVDNPNSLLFNDDDPDFSSGRNPDDTVTIDQQPVEGPSHGSVVINADGTFAYQHNGDGSRSDSFVYRITDTAGASDTATVFINIKGPDSDGDGLSDEEEAELGTDPNNPDTDGDGLSDGDEVNIHGTDPLVSDTDGDDIGDGVEVAYGSDPLVDDSTKIYVSAGNGDDANGGSSWDDAVRTNGRVEQLLAALGTERSSPTYVLYAEGDYGPLSVTANDIVFIGSLGPGIDTPAGWTEGPPPVGLRLTDTAIKKSATLKRDRTQAGSPRILRKQLTNEAVTLEQSTTPVTTRFKSFGDGRVVDIMGTSIHLDSIEIAGGDAFTEGGGGIRIVGGVTASGNRLLVVNNRAGSGGGIFLGANAMLMLEDSTLSGNFAGGDGATNAGRGGGLFNAGTLEVNRVDVLNNDAARLSSSVFGLGGGLFTDSGSKLLMERGFFQNNFADGSGGGLFVATDATQPFGDVAIRNSNIVNNFALLGFTFDASFDGGNGGGIAASGPFSLESSSVILNQAEANSARGTFHGGGGIHAAGGLQLRDSRLLENVADLGSGGGLLVGANVELEVRETIFVANLAGGGPGGGLHAPLAGGSGVPFSIVTSLFSSNAAAGPGGGVHVHTDGPVRIFNNLIVGNASDGGDGGGVEIENDVGALDFSSNTVAFNQLRQVTATGMGGGLSVDPVGSLTFRHNIIWFNDNATVNPPGSEEDGDNLLLGMPPLLAEGNNINETGAAGNIPAPGDPLFLGSFYIDQANSPALDGGVSTAADEGLGDPFTTSVDGNPDQGTVDIGFHHPEGDDGPMAALNPVSPASMAQLDGCGTVIEVKPVNADGVDLGPGQLLSGSLDANSVGQLASRTTLDPLGGGSRLATDRGDGFYQLVFSSAANGNVTLLIDIPGSMTQTVEYTTSGCAR